MEFSPANAPSLAAFAGILVAVVAALLWAVRRAYGTAKATGVAAGVLGLWLGLLSLLVATGALTRLPLRGLPQFFGSVLLMWTFAALSPLGRRLAATIPLTALVAFQVFRLPLELVLHSWAAQGTIPGTMTWTGQNWDIVSGITALVCAPFAARHRIAARIANIVGFAFLINVMRVAVLSSPLPLGWGQQPPLLLAFHLPYALIVPVCVGGALFGHIVLTRALWTNPSAQPSS